MQMRTMTVLVAAVAVLVSPSLALDNALSGLTAVRAWVSFECDKKPCLTNGARSIDEDALKTRLDLRLRKMGLEVAGLGHPTIEPIAMLAMQIISSGLPGLFVYKVNLEIGGEETIRGKKLVVTLWSVEYIGAVRAKDLREIANNMCEQALDHFENEWLTVNAEPRTKRK